MPNHAEIQQVKEELKANWDQLPVEYQAVFLLNQLRDILSGEYSDYMIVALRITFPDVWHSMDEDSN